MGQQNSGGVGGDGRAKHLSRSDEHRRNRASIDHGLLGNDILGVEHQQPQLFLQAMIEGGVDVVSKIFHRRFGGGDVGSDLLNVAAVTGPTELTLRQGNLGVGSDVEDQVGEELELVDAVGFALASAAHNEAYDSTPVSRVVSKKQGEAHSTE